MHSSAQEDFKLHSREYRGAISDPQSGIKLESPFRLRARDILISTADEALKWDNKQASVHVLSQTADLLWAEYPERSRAWLMQAWEMINAVNDEDANDAARQFRSSSPKSRARLAVLTVAQKHDQRLANRLLDQLSNEKEHSQYDSRRAVFNDRTARSEQLLDMALTFLESDPAASAKLAEQSLSDGISFQLQGLLLALRECDQAAANHVFDLALNRLATTFTHSSEGQVLASYLFTPGRVIGVRHSKTMALAVRTQTLTVSSTPAENDPVRARRFLGVMQRILLSMPAPSTTANPSQSAQEFITLSNSLANAFKLYAPELWISVEQRIAQVIPDLAPASTDKRLPPSVREKLRSAAGADEKELTRLYVEGLEEAAEKEDNPTARKLAFAQAALATAPEELMRGRKLAAKIDEGDLRQQIISFLVYRAALLDLEKNHLDQAIALVAEARPLERAIVLIAVAQRMTAGCSNMDKEQTCKLKLRALSLLSEAEKLLERKDFPNAVLSIRLGLIAALAPLDSVNALEAFRNITADINNNTSFDPSGTSAPRVTSLTVASDSSLPLIRNGYGLKDAVTSLARADFEGAVIITAKLNAPAVRGTSMLEIARTILSVGPGK